MWRGSKLFISSFVFATAVVNGAFADIACLTQIGQDKQNFLDPLKDIVGTQTLNQVFVDENKASIFGLVAGNVLNNCLNSSDFNKIADTDLVHIPFILNNQKYDMDVDTTVLFDYIDLPTAIVVVNDQTKKRGDAILKSDLPRDYFFSDSCSDHFVRVNISNRSPVNLAGQTAFAAYGGSENEFFLDMPVGKSNRAFPGLVLGDFGGWGAKEKIVSYKNYKEGRKAFKTFANKLRGTQCGNQGLTVYQVSVNNIPFETNGKQGWGVAAGITGGSMVYLGATSGLAAAGVTSGVVTTGAGLASTLGLVSMGTAGAGAAAGAAGAGAAAGAAGAAGAGGAATAAGAAMSWNPVGWIILGAVVVTTAVIAFWPQDLADIEQVVVLSEPELIR